MRIATWNLQNVSETNAKRGAIQQHIANINADIWVLTETDTKLKPGAGYQLVAHSSLAAPDRNGKRGAVWTAIWTRLQADCIDLSADPERTAAALIHPKAGAPVLVYGTVLPWRSDTRREPLMGGPAFCEVIDKQADEWTELIIKIRHLHPGARLCVAGDFNQAWENAEYGTALGRDKLVEVMKDQRHPLVCATGEKDPLPSAVNRPTIDHICISAPVTDFTVGYWPVRPAELEGLSDHYGLWLDVLHT
jgi:endonuclease/exonuclease/phosphatase family metal-dependent hydrolase